MALDFIEMASRDVLDPAAAPADEMMVGVRFRRQLKEAPAPSEIGLAHDPDRDEHLQGSVDGRKVDFGVSPNDLGVHLFGRKVVASGR